MRHAAGNQPAIAGFEHLLFVPDHKPHPSLREIADLLVGMGVLRHHRIFSDEHFDQCRAIAAVERPASHAREHLHRGDAVALGQHIFPLFKRLSE